MKNLIVANNQSEYKAAVRYMNLYLDGPTLVGADYETLATVRGARSHRHGITLRIDRTDAGDFIVTKEEEF